jgi:hypothetical protein
VSARQNLRFGDSSSYHILQEKCSVNDEVVTSLSDDDDDAVSKTTHTN